MLEAIDVHLPSDAAAQRIANTALSKGPHVAQRDIEICGTELHDLLLRGYAPSAVSDIKEREINIESGLLMQDQRIASWARRYARRKPM